MKYNPDNHHRRSIRLKGYDYSRAGTYFVTVCTQKRECLFGDIVDEEMWLNDAGLIVHGTWNDLSVKNPGIETDEFVVMPNHVHGIIVLNNVGAQFIAPKFIVPARNNRSVPQHFAINQNKVQGVTNQGEGVINHAPTVGEIVRAFKARCTHMINVVRNTPGSPIWQRNYYEHIIHSEEEIDRIRKYITENPIKWADDKDNPANQTPTYIP